MKTRTTAALEAMQKCRDLLRSKHYALTTTMVYVHGDGERVRSPLNAPVAMPVNVVPFVMERRAA